MMQMKKLKSLPRLVEVDEHKVSLENIVVVFFCQLQDWFALNNNESLY